MNRLKMLKYILRIYRYRWNRSCWILLIQLRCKFVFATFQKAVLFWFLVIKIFTHIFLELVLLLLTIWTWSFLVLFYWNLKYVSSFAAPIYNRFYLWIHWLDFMSFLKCNHFWPVLFTGIAPFSFINFFICKIKWMANFAFELVLVLITYFAFLEFAFVLFS